MFAERREFDEEMERIFGINTGLPEPQVTVSVHFCIEASKVKPSIPVDVSFRFHMAIFQ